jgi:hypothetical protein
MPPMSPTMGDLAAKAIIPDVIPLRGIRVISLIALVRAAGKIAIRPADAKSPICCPECCPKRSLA